jgi:tetratricopeptide (TPR) repeat protein
MNRIFLLFTTFFALLISCGDDKPKDTKPTSKDPILARIDAISEQLKTDKRNASILIERAKLYTSKEEFEKALSDYYMAIKIDSTKPAYYESLTEFFVQTGNIQKGIEASIIASDIDVKNPKHLINIGKCYFYLKEYQQSINYLNKAIEMDKFNPETYVFKGMVYQESKNYEKALSNYITASEQDPTWDAPYQKIALMYAEQKNDLALKYFDNAQRVNPKNMDAMYQKALYLKDSKRAEKAKIVLKDLIASKPQESKYLYSIGMIYFDQDSIDKAIQNFKLSTKVDQRYQKGYFMTGRCFEKQNKKKEAAELYNQCLVFGDDFEEAKEGLKRVK